MISRSMLWTASLASMALAMATVNSFAQSTPPARVNQGEKWTDALRKEFYTRDQGSRLIPLAWYKALKQPNGQPFMADNLQRYGYLPNDAGGPRDLPIGFNVAMQQGVETLGLTCSACHTRQIEVHGKAYRIDGGPAIADIGAFWADLDAAVNHVLTDSGAFSDFARGVLGPSPSAAKEAALHQEVQNWFEPFHAITDGGLLKLPKDRPWGVGRLDAVGMIFNRVTGLDIGAPPTYVIKENIKLADAPVRPPFLWNASIQDRTQWPGFAENGTTTTALARNLGEVYGVFGVYHPKKNDARPLGFDYVSDNSANFPGLLRLEELIEKLGPPKWPWPVDQQLAAAGKAIYNWEKERGGCVECHGVKELPDGRWTTPVTPIEQIRTDSKELLNLGRTVTTGTLAGASIPFLIDPLKAQNEAAAKVLGVSVRGAVLQYYFPGIRVPPKLRVSLAQLLSSSDEARALLKKSLDIPRIRAKLSELKGAYPEPAASVKPPPGYEARVLEGIWAAAPYLHNGSVPTLGELLKPAKDRVSGFKVGPAYDPVNVGLAVDQTKFNYTQQTDNCIDPRAPTGDGHCGHEFGTSLSPDEKKALLEYLKTL